MILTASSLGHEGGLPRLRGLGKAAAAPGGKAAGKAGAKKPTTAVGAAEGPPAKKRKTSAA